MTPVTPTANLADAIKQDGFAVAETRLPEHLLNQLRILCETARQRNNEQNVSNSSGTYGLRNLFDVIPEMKVLVEFPAIITPVAAVLGSNAFAVRATLFDKTAGANWGVFWHQDLSIAVKDRCELDGYSGWTRKAGVNSVQPPSEVMKRVLAVRLHLDDCTSANGALRVLPETHRLDRLAMDAVAEHEASGEEVLCEVEAGGLLLMRPLLLHASSPMDQPTQRRVLHLEFAAFDLPKPLDWMYRIPICLP